MVEAYIIRHGETEHNREGGITGQLDIPLNETGIKQADKLAERLEKQDFDAAYSSDLERTYETTKIVAEKHGLHPERYKEFREVSFGEMEGKPKEAWREFVKGKDVDRREVSPAGGESLVEAGSRMKDKLDELRRAHEGDKIIIGAHSVVIKALIVKILDLNEAGYKKLEQDNTAITVLNYNEEYGWIIQRMNDSAHLE